MDPTNPYIHFLIGFEFINKKCLEAAEESFNKALSFDDRHYLSWYSTFEGLKTPTFVTPTYGNVEYIIVQCM